MPELPYTPIARSFSAMQPTAGLLWSRWNRTSAEKVDPAAHALAWWSCSTVEHGLAGIRRRDDAGPSVLPIPRSRRHLKACCYDRGRCGGAVAETACASYANGPATMCWCAEPGKDAVLVRPRICDACLRARGSRPCPNCGPLWSHGSFETRSICSKLLKRRRAEQRGLPTLGWRRRRT